MPAFGDGQKGRVVRKIDSLIAQYIKEFGIQENVRLNEIKKVWCRLFSKPLSDHMAPSRLSAGEILVNVDSPAWLQQLKFFTEEILKKLRPYGVKTVRFRLGNVSMKLQSKTGRNKKQQRALSDQEIIYINETVSPVEDTELSDYIVRAMQKSFSVRSKPSH
jgi:hypothetical protein